MVPELEKQARVMSVFDKFEMPKLKEPALVRLRFRKVGNLQYISHLDLQRVFSHILTRSGVPVLKCLTFANADVAEFNVKENARITRHPVKDISLPRGVTIGGLIRNKEAVLVTGNTIIQAGDHVVVFCLEGMIKTIERYFN